MALTFENLIDHNKRTSLALVTGMIAFITALGGALFSALTQAGPEALPATFSTGAIGGASIAIIGSVVSYFGGSKIITSISNARRIERHEDVVLFNVVEEVSIAAGVPMPEIYVIDDESPNAFATGRDPKHAIIGITTGLRSKLNRDELQGVIAHEFAHIKNYDIRLMMLVGVFAGIIVLISDFFLRSFRPGLSFRGSGRRGGSSSSKNGGGALIAVAVIIIGFLLAMVAPLIAKFLQLAISREREYLADATAVRFTRNPLGLARALKKISMDPEKLACDNRATEHLFIINPDPKRRFANSDKDSVWSTHPPVIKRIMRLKKLAGDLGLSMEEMEQLS